MPDLSEIPTIDHTGQLDDVVEFPGYLLEPGQGPSRGSGVSPLGAGYSCCFCGVGDSGVAVVSTDPVAGDAPAGPEPGQGVLKVDVRGRPLELPASLHDGGRLEVATQVPLVPAGGVLMGTLEIDGSAQPITAREVDRSLASDGTLTSQTFARYARATTTSESVIKQLVPTGGCIKLKLSLMR